MPKNKLRTNLLMQKIRSKIYAALKFSESYLKTDMVYLAKGGAWITVGQIIVSAASFLLAAVMANFLPQATYGTYKYVLSIVGLLAIATMPELNSAIAQAVAAGHEGSFKPAVKIRMRWGTIGSAISVAISGYYFWQGDDVLKIAFLMIAVFLPLMEPLTMYFSFLQGKKLFKESSLYNAAVQLISVATMIVTIHFSKNILIILLAYFFSLTLSRLLFYEITLAKFPPNDQHDHDTMRYGRHLNLISIGEIVVDQLDKILLWHTLGAQAVAIYFFSTMPIDQFRNLLSFMKAIAFPKLTAQDPETLKKTLPIKMLKLSAIISIPVLIYILLAPYLFDIVFPQYRESVIYSQIAALSLLFYAKKFMGMSLLAKKQIRSMYTSSVSVSVFNILAFLLLIPRFGIMGAILADLATHIFNTFLLFYLFKKI